MDSLVCSGWDEELCKYWWRCVGFMWRSVNNWPLRSNKEILFLSDSRVNLRLVVKLLISSMFWVFPFHESRWKKLSSIYRSHNKGWNSWLAKNSQFSKFSKTDHINKRIRWDKFSTYSCSGYLLDYPCIKFRVIIT